MKIENICKIKGGRQDGAIFGGYMFSFDHQGECTVYRIKDLEKAKGCEAEIFSEFVLDRCDILKPHSNAVMFGNEYYDKKDEFPLLYSNIYNNYAGCEDKLKGVCLVYRVQRAGNVFTTTLVQMIEIGFVEDDTLWKSSGEKEDARPFGNFVTDTEKSILYAFTMRDNTDSTAYFSFKLPKVTDGDIYEKYNIKKVVLTKADILTHFECDYHHFIQGATMHRGMIYSLEGFSNSEENPPAVRIIDAEKGKQVIYQQFRELGSMVESELVDFDGDVCYYSDHNGNVYRLTVKGE